MKSRIGYVLLLLFTFLMCVVWFDPFALFLLGFEILLLPAMFLLNHFIAKRLTFSLDVPMSVEKNSDISVEVHVKNRGFVPAASVSVEICCRDEFEEVWMSKRIEGAVDAGKETVFCLTAAASYAGNLRFGIGHVQLRDLFGLWRTRVKLSKETQKVLVMPDFYPVEVRMEELSAGVLQQGNRHSDNRRGDDVSEIFDTRDFREGDTLQKVHWKLSAKMDELLVKEFSLPIEKSLWIYVDLYWEEKSACTHEHWDELLTVLASLSRSLLLAKCSFEVLWYDEKREQVFRCPVTGEELLSEMIGQFADAGISSFPHKLEELCPEEEYQEHYEIITLDTQLRLSVGDRQLAALEGAQLGRELNKLRVEIKGW